MAMKRKERKPSKADAPKREFEEAQAEIDAENRAKRRHPAFGKRKRPSLDDDPGMEDWLRASPRRERKKAGREFLLEGSAYLWVPARKPPFTEYKIFLKNFAPELDEVWRECNWRVRDGRRHEKQLRRMAEETERLTGIGRKRAEKAIHKEMSLFWQEYRKDRGPILNFLRHRHSLLGAERAEKHLPSDKERLILELRIFKHWTYEAVAEHCHVSKGRVSSTLKDAAGQVRDLLLETDGCPWDAETIKDILMYPPSYGTGEVEGSLKGPRQGPAQGLHLCPPGTMPCLVHRLNWIGNRKAKGVPPGCEIHHRGHGDRHDNAPVRLIALPKWFHQILDGVARG